jgi:hypothetical protein
MIGCAGLEGESLGDLLEGVGGKRPLDEQTIVAGLRDALRVGTENTVQQTSQTDGFLGNELIRIPLPESFQSVGNALRKVGFGSQVDELEVAMNRGAETAAGEAGDVFLSAIQDMTIGDARSILEGGDTAATDYFRGATEDELRTRFEPIVDTGLQKAGAVQLYDQIMGRYRTIPFAPDPGLDLREYVTDEALDGLFTVLAQEEQKIRTDPTARVTSLLQRVFGN